MAEAFRDLPEALTLDPPSRARCAQGSSSSSARRCCRSSRCPRATTSRLLPARLAGRPGEALRAVPGRGSQQSTRRRIAQRLELELDVITSMKYPGYFLIVWDFIREAKARGIPVGPGRGSGAGSLVAYRARHHGDRPDPVSPAVRALPEPRAREHAGLRRRLLHGAARRGDRLRRGQVRQGQRRTDRDLPEPQGAQRDQGRRAGDGHRGHGRAADREPGAGPRARARRPPSSRRWRWSPSSRQLVECRSDRRRADPTGQEARRPDASRRHARRRRRDQRRARSTTTCRASRAIRTSSRSTTRTTSRRRVSSSSTSSG